MLRKPIVAGSFYERKRDRLLNEIENCFLDIFKFAMGRFRYGAQEYGPYDPKEDKRDIVTEIKEELADVIIYAGMLMMKLDYVNEKIKVGGFNECRCHLKTEKSST